MDYHAAASLMHTIFMFRVDFVHRIINVLLPSLLSSVYKLSISVLLHVHLDPSTMHVVSLQPLQVQTWHSLCDVLP